MAGLGFNFNTSVLWDVEWVSGISQLNKNDWRTTKSRDKRDEAETQTKNCLCGFFRFFFFLNPFVLFHYQWLKQTKISSLAEERDSCWACENLNGCLEWRGTGSFLFAWSLFLESRLYLIGENMPVWASGSNGRDVFSLRDTNAVCDVSNTFDLVLNCISEKLFLYSQHSLCLEYC